MHSADRIAPDLDDDRTAQAIADFLRSAGAGDARHAGGRSLLDHLLETYLVVRRWRQPAWLQHAALIHSIYGTDARPDQQVSPTRRADVAAVAGERAERTAYMFCVLPTRPLFAGTHLWARDLPMRSIDGSSDPEAQTQPSRAELDAVVLLHMANGAEQIQAADGRPGRWLVGVRDLGELLAGSEAVQQPPFLASLSALTDADEARARRAYLEALQDDQASADGLALAAAVCPALPEPCVWQAYLARRRGDLSACREWAGEAGKRLELLGTAWDKRLKYPEWLQLIDALERSGGGPDADRLPGPFSHPRALLQAVVAERPLAEAGERPQVVVSATSASHAAVDAAAGRQRFERYLTALATADENARRPGAVYPDLPSRPWHDPAAFPLAGYLQANFPAIRDEILALDAGRFHPEAERIGRTGDWDVAFFYERGRRRDDVCSACPVTTYGIEAHRTVRTMAGLIYVSRMRAGTHIAAHRGPTNLRLRCHLGIKVPDGDCAIRVGDRTEPWREGHCLVFDDFFEHEAWNRTEEDRVVLIVDLWHPGLSPIEVRLLEGLQRYTYRHAQKLAGYWSANAAAAGRPD